MSYLDEFSHLPGLGKIWRQIFIEINISGGYEILTVIVTTANNMLHRKLPPPPTTRKLFSPMSPNDLFPFITFRFGITTIVAFWRVFFVDG